VRSAFQKCDGVGKAFIELLGSEQELDEKRQKRAEARAKRREEIDKAMSENSPPDGSGTPRVCRQYSKARAARRGLYCMRNNSLSFFLGVTAPLFCIGARL
jgi:hypothetical protein